MKVSSGFNLKAFLRAISAFILLFIIGTGCDSKDIANIAIQLEAPEIISITFSNLKVIIKWHPLDFPEAITYEVVRGENPETLSSQYVSQATFYVDDSVKEGTTYWYSVRAWSESGLHSDFADPVSITIPTSSQEPPSDSDTSTACTPGETRRCGTDVGECSFGVETCLADGTWGTCEGAIGPSQEVCDGKDNDCDGEYDENLFCFCESISDAVMLLDISPPEGTRLSPGSVVNFSMTVGYHLTTTYTAVLSASVYEKSFEPVLVYGTQPATRPVKITVSQECGTAQFSFTYPVPNTFNISVMSELYTPTFGTIRDGAIYPVLSEGYVKKLTLTPPNHVLVADPKWQVNFTGEFYAPYTNYQIEALARLVNANFPTNSFSFDILESSYASLSPDSPSVITFTPLPEYFSGDNNPILNCKIPQYYYISGFTINGNGIVTMAQAFINTYPAGYIYHSTPDKIKLVYFYDTQENTMIERVPVSLYYRSITSVSIKDQCKKSSIEVYNVSSTLPWLGYEVLKNNANEVFLKFIVTDSTVTPGYYSTTALVGITSSAGISTTVPVDIDIWVRKSPNKTFCDIPNLKYVTTITATESVRQRFSRPQQVDIEYATICYIPYESGGYDVMAGPSTFPHVPTGGTLLSLRSYDAIEVPLPQNFTFYSKSYTSVFVSSTGYLTFSQASVNSNPNDWDYISEIERIAFFWDNLAPDVKGGVYAQILTDRCVINYLDIPQIDVLSDSNNAQIELFFSTGEIIVTYGRVDTYDFYAGVSPPGSGPSVDFIP